MDEPRLRTIVTLRARWTDGEPAVGVLMASATGKTVYRIVKITKLRAAGDTPLAYRFRLSCVRLSRSEVPEGAEIAPWLWDRRTARPRPALGRPTADPGPAEPPGARMARIRAKAPLLLALAGESIRQANAATEAAQLARARRVGYDGPPESANFGPGIRRRVMRDRKGRLLREPDVEVREAVDPRNPNKKLFRARLCDPLDALVRCRTISKRERDAADKVRSMLEYAVPPMAGGIGGEVHVPPFARQPISKRHIDAAHMLRKAAAAVGPRYWSPVLWVCLGGTVRGYAKQWHIATLTASTLVSDGMGRLADHCFGTKERKAA